MRQNQKDAVRLNKLIAESGLWSRREADLLIEQERVVVNGHIAKMGQKVFKTDFIRIDGELLKIEAEPTDDIDELPTEVAAHKHAFKKSADTKRKGAAHDEAEHTERKEVGGRKGRGSDAKKAASPVEKKASKAPKAPEKRPQAKAPKSEGAAKKWFSGRKSRTR